MDREESSDHFADEEAPAEASRPRPQLTIGPGAGWVRVGCGPQISLGRRHVLRGIVLILAGAHRERRRPLTAEELIARGWPDDRLTHGVMINRLHVAINTLRAMGLREVLLSRRPGYHFSPAFEITFASDDNTPLTVSEITSSSRSFSASSAL